jgi:hypothetical protein
MSASTASDLGFWLEHDPIALARALCRIQRAARLVEYDLWRVWPIEDERPDVIRDLMPWMPELAADLLHPDGPENVLTDLVTHVLSSCAPSLSDHEKLLTFFLLHHRVTQNRAILRALAER